MTNQQFNPQDYQFEQQKPDIPNHLVLAILTTIFCCLPLGIVSIVYAVQVDNAIISNDFSKARMLSQKAETWGMRSLWLGVAWIIIAAMVSLLPHILVGIIALSGSSY